jgi:hypothetical protein
MTESLGSPVPSTAIEFAGPMPESGDDAARAAFGVTPGYGSPATVASWPAELLHHRLPQASDIALAGIMDLRSAMLCLQRPPWP